MKKDSIEESVSRLAKLEEKMIEAAKLMFKAAQSPEERKRMKALFNVAKSIGAIVATLTQTNMMLEDHYNEVDELYLKVQTHLGNAPTLEDMGWTPPK